MKYSTLKKILMTILLIIVFFYLKSSHFIIKTERKLRHCNFAYIISRKVINNYHFKPLYWITWYYIVCCVSVVYRDSYCETNPPLNYTMY